MKGAEKIGSVGAICLLFTCRIFGLLTYTMAGNSAPVAAASMVAMVLTGVFSVALCAVMLKLFERAGVANIFDYVSLAGGFLSKLSLLLFGFAFLAVAISTVVNFQYFISVVAYPGLGSTVFVITLILGAAYAAYLGIEAVTRFSVLVGIFVILAFVIITAALVGEIQIEFLQSPLRGGINPIANVFYEGIVGNTELLAFLVIAKSCPKNGKRIFPKIMLLSVLSFELMTFLSAATLGEYAATQSFPIYAMMASASFSILQRLDFLHLVVWIFISFLKCAFYFYCATRCFTNFAPTVRTDKTLLGLSVFVGVASLTILSRLSYIDLMRKFLSTGVIFWVCIILLPVICTLAIAVKKRRVKA